MLQNGFLAGAACAELVTAGLTAAASARVETASSSLFREFSCRVPSRRSVPGNGHAASRPRHRTTTPAPMPRRAKPPCWIAVPVKSSQGATADERLKFLARQSSATAPGKTTTRTPKKSILAARIQCAFAALANVNVEPVVVMMVVMVMIAPEIPPRHHPEKAVVMVMMVMVIELRQLHWLLLSRICGDPRIVNLQCVQRIWNRLQEVSVSGDRRGSLCGLGCRLRGMQCSERRCGAKQSSDFPIHGVVPKWVMNRLFSSDSVGQFSKDILVPRAAWKEHSSRKRSFNVVVRRAAARQPFQHRFERDFFNL